MWFRPAAFASAVAAITAATLLSSCSAGGGTALAHEACAYVSTSLTEEAAAAHATPARGAVLRQEAVVGLERASPLAGMAAGQDGTWEALQATLSEAGQVPVRYLVQALTAECAPVGSS